tara:strand:+ start:11889 stop:12029 length:141 start_codon:yes stop_codon:yes gene_type:complete
MKKAIALLIAQIQKAKEAGNKKDIVQKLQQQLDKLIKYGTDTTTAN